MFASLHLPPHYLLLSYGLNWIWLIVGILLCYACFRLRHTTLAWPIVWCIGLWPVFAIALCVPPNEGSGIPEYTAAVTAIMPTLALLGAKRPQSGAWQCIVVTLLGVLLFPIVKGYAFGEDHIQVPILFRWLIAAHIVIGAVNYLPTRYAVPAGLFAAAQYFICRPYLPFSDGRGWNDYAYALPCLIVAYFWAEWTADFGPRAVPKPGLSRLWRDFRDAYGIVWGLRVAERLNASAVKHGWPVEFAWGGIVVKTESGELPADVEHRVERELRSMLRRFVSHDWIARRLHDTAGGAGGGN